MPRIQGNKPPAKPTVIQRFRIATTIDGYEVVDQDGRAVSDAFEYANEALEIAGELNTAAQTGTRALQKALGAIESAFEPIA